MAGLSASSSSSSIATKLDCSTLCCAYQCALKSQVRRFKLLIVILESLNELKACQAPLGVTSFIFYRDNNRQCTDLMHQLILLQHNMHCILLPAA